MGSNELEREKLAMKEVHTMKTITIFLSFMLAAMISPLHADSLTVPNTFTAGSPAVAAEVNANFGAVKSSVDDNDARITTNTNAINSQATSISTNTSNISNNAATILSNTSAITNLGTDKQNLVLGACESGYAIRAINADGSVICELDNDSEGDITEVTAGGGLTGGGTIGSVNLSLATGAISVSPTALSPIQSNGCETFKSPNSYYYSTTSTITYCDSYVPLQLPDRATLTNLACRLYDNDPSGISAVLIYQTRSDTGSSSIIFETSPTINSTLVQTQTDTTPTNTVVSNNIYHYALYWNGTGINTATVGTNSRFINCTIYYTYN